MIAVPFPGLVTANPPPNPVASMDFEAGAGGTTFTDNGTAGSAWTRSGSNVTTETTVPLDGVSSLRVNGQNDYLQTDLTSGNGLPATGDWDMEFRFRLSEVASRYIISAQGTTGDQNDTQFAVATNINGRVVFIVSNGTTRSVLFGGSDEGISVNTIYLLRISRRQDVYSISFNGALTSRATFSGNINQPSSRKIRIGLGEASGTVTASTMYFDSFRIVRYP